MSKSKHYLPCPAPDCTKPGDFCRGFCCQHYLAFRRACKANGSWYSGAPLVSPIVISHFVWEGDEDSLAAMVEEQERLRAIKDAQQELKSNEESNDHV